jgi:hypothetical protein
MNSGFWVLDFWGFSLEACGFFQIVHLFGGMDNMGFRIWGSEFGGLGKKDFIGKLFFESSFAPGFGK